MKSVYTAVGTGSLNKAVTISPGRIARSDYEKAVALADSLEAQFRPVTVPSAPTVIEMVDVALESYLQTPSSETGDQP